MYFILLIFISWKVDWIFSQGICQCPPGLFILPSNRKGTLESQPAYCMQKCVVTVLVEDPEQIVQLTFINIDDSFRVIVLDGGSPTSPILQNCYPSNGQQCYSTYNQVTIIFEGILASSSTVQIFLHAMDRSLRPTENATTSIDTTLLIALILSSVFILILFFGMFGICYAGYRKRKYQKKIESMQACMIYTEPVWRTNEIIRAF